MLTRVIAHNSVQCISERDSDSAAEFWQRATSFGKSAQSYASSIIRNVTNKADAAVAAQVKHVSDTVHGIVSDTGKLKVTIEREHGAPFDDIQQNVQQTFADLLQQLQESSLSLNRTLDHAERLGNIALALQSVETAFVNLSVLHGMSEQQLKAHLDPILEHVKDAFVTLGLSSFLASWCPFR